MACDGPSPGLARLVFRTSGEGRWVARFIACRKSVKSNAAYGWLAVLEDMASTIRQWRASSLRAASLMAIRRGACLRLMSWFGPEVCSAEWWRREFTGAHDR